MGGRHSGSHRCGHGPDDPQQVNTSLHQDIDVTQNVTYDTCICVLTCSPVSHAATEVLSLAEMPGHQNLTMEKRYLSRICLKYKRRHMFFPQFIRFGHRFEDAVEFAAGRPDQPRTTLLEKRINLYKFHEVCLLGCGCSMV